MKSGRLFLIALLLFPPPAFTLDSPVNNVGASTDKVIPPTTDSPNNQGPTSPDRVLPDEPPKRKNVHWIPALEIPSFLFLLNQADQRIYPNTVYNVTPDTFKEHFLHGHWHYDDDPFTINQAGHPYQGATMYGFARSAGLNFWESLGYANAGSLMWKIGGETDDPSINDQITTGQAGSILGEELYRMASLVLEQGGEHPDAWKRMGGRCDFPADGFKPAHLRRTLPTRRKPQSGDLYTTRTRRQQHRHRYRQPRPRP